MSVLDDMALVKVFWAVTFFQQSSLWMRWSPRPDETVSLCDALLRAELLVEVDLLVEGVVSMRLPRLALQQTAANDAVGCHQ